MLKTVVIVVSIILIMVIFMTNRSSNRIEGVKARQLVDGGATLVDVRTPGEYASGHVSGAKNIPVQELAGRMDEIPKDRPVVLYCRSGMRSAKAAGMLTAKGYEDVYDVGPMSAYPAE